MICKPLYELTKNCKSNAEVIKILMDRKLLSNSALKDLEIVYEYRRNLEKTGGRKLNAVHDTAINKNISSRKVYKARERFDED